MKEKIEEILEVLEKDREFNLNIYLFENRKTKKNPYNIYKLLFDNGVSNVVINALKNEIANFLDIMDELDNHIPEYNPDAEQRLFKINKDEIQILNDIYSYIVGENDVIILSNTRLSDKSKIRAWIVQLEYEYEENTKEVFFFQKFIKSQFFSSKKLFFVLQNNEYKLISKQVLSMYPVFDVLLIDGEIISKKIEVFEYIFDFVNHYMNKSLEFLDHLNNLDNFQIDDEAKEMLSQKISSSKHIAHKLYSSYRNGYYKYIDINKLKELKAEIGLKINITDGTIVIDNDTSLNDWIKVLNDDFEISLLTNNKYITYKKEKLG